MSVSIGRLNGVWFIHSASSAYQSCPWALSILSSSAFIYPEGNVRRNQLLDGSISLTPLEPRSDDRFARQNRYGLHREFPLASSCPAIVSPSFGSQRVRSTPPLQIERGGSPVRPAREKRETGSRMAAGEPSAGLYFHFAARAYSDPLTRAHVRRLLVRVSRRVGW
ncbi:hypothetical protein JTE90_017335 [Oedothorax gibbosus]|uniref:Uncharacterized protein n=1 Tax=Oedothorax gibbosus TaxID=931172 RepID=A0AAV6TFK6_9ARAC|nr:hypothetical protein JTE90_017335 [Oedothorax gibbosus]